MTYDEKFEEIRNLIDQNPCSADVHIVVQHFCFETWALGSRKIVRTNTSDSTLRGYLNFFDVTQEDPELLTPSPGSGINRSQFALVYLRKAINDKNPSKTYRKGSPGFLLNHGYYSQVKKRFDQTRHISSFSAFLNAFV